MKKIMLVMMLAAAPFTLQAGSTRIQKIDYSATDIIPVRVNRHYASMIVLEEGEAILGKVSGATEEWEISAKIGDRYIYLKPRSSAKTSNLLVTISKRTYIFSLQVLPDNEAGQWQISFNYNDQDKSLQRVIVETSTVKEFLGQKQPILNWAYTMEAGPNSEGIIPSEVYDDGRFTYVHISGGKEQPAVFRINSDGSESLVNKRVDDRNLIVLHETGTRFVLRLGKQVVGLWNEAFDDRGRPPVADTVSDNVVRSAKGEGR